MDKPFFSKRLIACAPDGRFAAFSFRKRVVLSREGLRLGGVLIDPVYIEDLVAYGQVLRVRYATSSGSRAEQCFVYRTFLAKTGAASLRDAVQRASREWAGRTGAAVQAIPLPRPEIQMSVPSIGAKGSDSRTRVALSTAKVAFPTICPVCCRTAVHVSVCNVSAGGAERGMWLVPVCDEHQIGDALRVERWRANGTEVAFSFAEPDYARQFARANDSTELKPNSAPGAAASDGRSFVMYKYVFSLLYFSAMLSSRVIAIRAGGSRLVPGLKYSALTAVTGWWAIPGLIFTIRALVCNFKGGVDVTPLARQALAGTAVSAYGVR